MKVTSVRNGHVQIQMENRLNGHIGTRKYKSYLGKGLTIKLVAISGMHCQECGKLFIHKRNLIRHYLHTHVAKKTIHVSNAINNFIVSIINFNTKDIAITLNIAQVDQKENSLQKPIHLVKSKSVIN